VTQWDHRARELEHGWVGIISMGREGAQSFQSTLVAKPTGKRSPMGEGRRRRSGQASMHAGEVMAEARARPGSADGRVDQGQEIS
jgi:hypothetical protein